MVDWMFAQRIENYGWLGILWEGKISRVSQEFRFRNSDSGIQIASDVNPAAAG